MAPRILIGASALFLSVVLAAACSWLPFWDADQAEPGYDLMPFTDIGIPPKSDLDEKGTRVREDGLGRVGVMLLETRLDAEDTLAFYREDMSRRGWTPAGYFERAGRKVLIFNKGERAAVIEVEEGYIRNEVEIHVGGKSY